MSNPFSFAVAKRDVNNKPISILSLMTAASPCNTILQNLPKIEAGEVVEMDVLITQISDVKLYSCEEVLKNSKFQTEKLKKAYKTFKENAPQARYFNVTFTTTILTDGFDIAPSKVQCMSFYEDSAFFDKFNELSNENGYNGGLIATIEISQSEGSLYKSVKWLEIVHDIAEAEPQPQAQVVVINAPTGRRR